jgi:hypothetical protein
MAKLLNSGFLNLTLALTNYQVVVAIFLGLAVAVGLIELSATEGRTVEKVARMVVVVVEIAALQLDLAENSRSVIARSSSEVGSALRRRCSTLLSLAEFR